MSDDPFRLRILKALTDRIATVTIADGYHHDLTENVFRGREYFGDGDPIPLVSIFEKVDPEAFGEAATGSGKAKTTLDLRIQGFVRDDPYNPLDPAYRLLADLQRVLTLARLERNEAGERDILGQGGRVSDLDVGQGSAAPPGNEVSDYAFAFLPVRISFVEDRENPFA